MDGKFDEQIVFAALTKLQSDYDRLAEFLSHELVDGWEIDFTGDVNPIGLDVRRLTESLGYRWQDIQADADRMRQKEKGPARRFIVTLDSGEKFATGEGDFRCLSNSIFSAGTRFCRIRDGNGREVLVNLNRIVTVREEE
jgi:hypothetical protein